MPLNLQRTIGRALGRIQLPADLDDWVDSYVFEVGDDPRGEPTVFVWVITTTGVSEDVLPANSLHRIEDVVRRGLEGLPRSLYIRFRTALEQEELER